MLSRVIPAVETRVPRPPPLARDQTRDARADLEPLPQEAAKIELCVV